MQASDLLKLIPTLPRPLVLLESGKGTGQLRLGFGQRDELTVPWYEQSVGDLERLKGFADRRRYGFVAYDLGLPPRARRRQPMLEQPLAHWFEPRGELVLNSASGEVISMEGEAHELTIEDGDASEAVPSARTGVARRASSFTSETFAAAVEAVREYIASGDVYQANISVARMYDVEDDPWEVYLRLRELNPSPWMGYADFGDWQLVSGSPELLVEADLTRNTARLRPIAGTRKKTGDTGRDAAMRTELEADYKENAEHLMLVDLARNDLGRIARYGSLAVDELRTIEEYSHVFHLVSEVSCELRRGTSAARILQATFPGGTITGVPKVRAMEVISELEPVARGCYTGGLGWVGPDGMQVNILIRSAAFRKGSALVQAGAGIVWDSIPEREWRESLRKAKAMELAIGVVDDDRV